jgi:non-ribosomal peptide synthase protein (TIGR01720 family)
MIPSAFVTLDALPLNANGKVDRKALPTPVTDGQENGHAEAPRTENERTLAEIWAQTLQRDSVAPSDNFFELGGDSILAIQVIARARQAGLELTPMDIFEHQTLAEQAAVARDATAIVTEQGPVVGTAPMLPFQQWFLEQAWKEPQHWNMAVLLNTPAEVDVATLRRAMGTVLEHHDALRTRFRRTAGSWTQELAPPTALPGEELVAFRDLADVPQAARTERLEAIAGELHTSLDLERGPLSRAAWISLGADEPGRLLWVVHHLVIDGVSWRVVLEDLQAAYAQLTDGRAPLLPAKTTDFPSAARALESYATKLVQADESDFWLEAPERAAVLPCDQDAGENIEGSVEIVSASLTVSETNALLGPAHAAYRTQVNDLLLCSLAETLGEWSDETRIGIELEGHGREDLFKGVDVSRTVGCFTSLFPVTLDLGYENDRGARLKSIKEQLRTIPQRGIGYGLLRYMTGDAASALATVDAPEVSFNYLGQFDQLRDGSLIRSLAPEGVGTLRSPSGTRRHLIEVLGQVIDGQLRFDWRFSVHRHQRATVERLASRHVETLQSLLEHCLEPEHEGATPSDFPVGAVSQRQLDGLLERLRSTTGQSFRSSVDRLHAISPMQHGMLYQTILAPDSEIYFLQFRLELEGHVDIAAVEEIWSRLLDRHSVLRSAFEWDELVEPLQVIYRAAHFPIGHEDWSGVAADEVPARLETWLAEDRKLGFDLSRAPAHRVAVLSVGEDRHHFVWSIHHALVDAWSVGIVLNEFLQLYAAHNTSQDVDLPAAPGFASYVEWQRQHPRDEAAAHFGRLLGGFQEPCKLAFDRGAETATGGFDLHQAKLTAEEAAALQTLARAEHLTLGTLVHGLWAVALGEASGTDDVVFGSVLSGRSPALPGVERTVGMFINTLPIRLQLASDDSFLPWLRALGEQQIRLRDFEHCSLAEVRGWCRIAAEIPMFDTVFSFENQPMGSSDDRGSGPLRMTGFAFIDWNDMPLSVAVMPGDGLAIDLKSQRGRFEATDTARLLRLFVHLLREAPLLEQATLGDLQERYRTAQSEEASEQQQQLSTASRQRLKGIRRRGGPRRGSDSEVG